ncbi:helix-turn-helix domain-containing protein [Sinorhizobium fredii]|uniref:helix-turn-helix domain-containing protein n=1 Tax=Rhizobium fredii TaxID=380 RepID=UPI001FCB0FF0|nr:helix-turn-helix transcriptional regulator [Sinorhizobium fredii]
MSQTKLAQALGITYQQVRKYENGRTKVSASRLQAIANALKYRSHLSSSTRLPETTVARPGWTPADRWERLSPARWELLSIAPSPGSPMAR